MEPASAPIERFDPVRTNGVTPADPPPPADTLPPGWPDRLVLGIVSEGDGLDLSALTTLGELLSLQLGIPVRATVHADTATLADELAARRIDVALLDLPQAIEGERLADSGATLQVVRRGRTDALTAWVSAHVDDWCPDAVATTPIEPGRRVRTCENVDAPGERDDGDVLARLVTGEMALVRPDVSSTLSYYLDRIVDELEREAREDAGVPDPGADADDVEDDEAPDVVTTVNVASSALLATLSDQERTVALVRIDSGDIDASDLVVVGWGPPVPQPVVVLRPGLPSDVTHAVNTALTAVIAVPRGAAAFLDLAGVEGWELLDEDALDSTREVVGDAAS